MLRRAATRGSLVALLIALCVMPLASGQSRIVNGQPAEQGEYPAVGYLEIDAAPFSGACGGTLVTPRRFLTAGHCAAQQNVALPPSSFRVTLGQRDLRLATTADRWRARTAEVHPLHTSTLTGERYDVAMLTLDRRAPFTPQPIVTRRESWADGVLSTIVGWGTTCFDTCDPSPLQLENAGDVPVRPDGECATAYPADFDPSIMFCAGNGTADTCQGDSGGPLLVPESSRLVQAGVTSFGEDCNRADRPGVYARIGEGPLNEWVLEHTLDFEPPAAPEATVSAAFAAITAHPSGAGYFSAYRWDFEDNGTVDATGASPSHSFPSPGRYTVRLEGDREGRTITTRQAVDVGAAPVVAPTATPAPSVTPAPKVTPVLPRKRYFTILAPSRARVDTRRRFRIRLRFLSDAPTGRRAVVQARRSSSRLARTSLAVRRGQTRTVRVTLTPSAYRRLGRASGRRLKVQLRVSLAGVVKRKTVTLLRRKPPTGSTGSARAPTG